MRFFILFLMLQSCFLVRSQQVCMEGKEYPMPLLSEAARANHLLNLKQAEEALVLDSANADKLIWLGRRLAYAGEYEKAIEVYSKGIELHPEDARIYRHRGHRYITLRCFDKAITDFENAAVLLKGQKDETEPDGIPNAKNLPVSTLHTNTWYHLGLAYFLKADFAKAEAAYREGLLVSTNADMQTAMANWYYISLLSQGKKEKADSLYATINQDAELIENGDYLSLLYFYRHKPGENEIERYTDALMIKNTGKKDTVSVSAATLYFGAGYYAKLKGMNAKATLLFQKAIATGQWSSFGYIAAEAELKRVK